MKIDEGYNSPIQWYALRVKSRCEKLVASAARGRGFEEFLPLCLERHRWSDRMKTVELPLFPGYVFCRLNVENRLPLLTIPGALHFVGIGKTPIPLDDTEVLAIQSAVSSTLWTEPWPYVEVGQRVRLEAGPLAGLEGILVEKRKQYRIVVSVTLLQRSMAVEIERDWVAPIDATGRRISSLPPITPVLVQRASGVR